MDLNGGNFQTVHTFTGGPTDGAFPQDLLEYHSVLYGLTGGQGIGNLGSVLFRTNLDGSNYQVLRVFDNNPAGSGILGRLSTDGTSLYGTTYTSQFGDGAVYKVGLDGSNFKVLHSFSGPDGDRPLDGATVVQSKLFGITEYGGTTSNGALYTLNDDGTGFKTLHSFSGGSNDGAVPVGAPLLLGSKLYGTTLEGGEFNHGTVYSVNADGTGHQILHSFDISDGYQLETALVTDGTTLYGVAKLGGAGNLDGTIFSLAPDGSGFQVLHALGWADGFQPSYPLTYDQGTLYGTTLSGGSKVDGTVFALSVPEPTTISFLLPAILLALRRRATQSPPRCRL
jgi:uncharacterized repeat protein (TIGR03803 family)